MPCVWLLIGLRPDPYTESSPLGPREITMPRPHRFHRLLTLGLAALVLATSPTFAQPDAESPEARREQARIDSLWNRAWREFAPYYLEHDGGFVCVPGYDRSLPSSTGVSIREYQQRTAWEQEYTDERGRERTRTLVKPDEEAHAAVATIPEVAVGRYGYIHSGNIDRIVDGKTLILEDIWLLDAAAAVEEVKELKAAVVQGLVEDVEGALRNRGRDERRNRGDGIARRRGAENEAIDWAYEDRTAAARRQRDRAFSRYDWEVVGYRTDRLTEDARWPTGRAAEEGLQLIIVDVAGTTVTAVPAATLGRGLDEVAFLDMLAQRDITKAQFVEMVTEAKRESRDGYLPILLAQLEGDEVETETGVDPEDGPNDSVELAD